MTVTATEIPPMLTTNEVAKMLKISNSTLCRWRTVGKGPRVYWLSDDAPRYMLADVLAWLEEVAA